jgi:hypothetical protein
LVQLAIIQNGTYLIIVRRGCFHQDT